MKRDTTGKFAGSLLYKMGRAWAFFYRVFLFTTGVWFGLALLLAIGGAFFSTHDTHASTEIVIAGKSEAPKENQLKAAMLKGELLEIIRKHETTNTVIKSGEILGSFDPNSKMRAQCMVIGGKRPIDCESYGIYQEKVGTIINYAPQIYGHDVTQLEAMTIANDEEKASDFLLQCAVKINGCIWNWTSANNNHAVVEDLINKIRSLEK